MFGEQSLKVSQLCVPVLLQILHFTYFFCPSWIFNGTLEFVHLFKVSIHIQKSNMDIVIVRIYELDTFYVQR